MGGQSLSFKLSKEIRIGKFLTIELRRNFTAMHSLLCKYAVHVSGHRSKRTPTTPPLSRSQNLTTSPPLLRDIPTWAASNRYFPGGRRMST
ncbi:hypothetical protein TWF217_000188 [Orbilia oligospora]|nr:hypothetical protein TWF128_003395 [Orbilia oligospora]KAF3272720.1 hypothetical protein TWF217_000188 [Orbilia oligospora]